MKIIKKILSFFIITIMIMVSFFNFTINNAYANHTSDIKTPVKIGVFLDNSNAMYISLLKQNLERIERENKDKVTFTFFDAKDNQILQNESIEKALDDNFDLFIIGIITPNLNDVKSTLDKVMQKNIPFIINPDPTQDIIDYVKPYKRFVIIGADFEQSGTMEGQLLVDEWKANKKSLDKNGDNILQYIMLRGRVGSPLTFLRTKYSVLALNDAGIKTQELAAPYCEWLEDCAENAIESLILKYGNKIEAIISNNDAMAVGAVEALQKYGYNKGNKEMIIPVVGIDGMPAAKELIQKGFMTGTVVVEPHDLAEALYSIGINLAYGKNPIENTQYRFDDTGFTVHLPYTKYKK